MDDSIYILPNVVAAEKGAFRCSTTTVGLIIYLYEITNFVGGDLKKEGDCCGLYNMYEMICTISAFVEI